MLGKIKAFVYWKFYSVIFHICRLFPLGDKVIFSNFSGKRYGDNPKYISEGLHREDPDCRIIWQRHYDYKFDVPDYVKVVRWPSVRFMYELATSKVWVDSHLKKTWMKKRKNQYFIETWHGGLGFKKIEGDAEHTGWKEELDEAYHTAQIADVFVSNSDWISDIYRRAFKYNGEILETGYPKNDIFFQDNEVVRKKVRDYYRLGADEQIVLYAPTFRDIPKRETYSLDLERIRQVFEMRFHTKCKMLVRMHPMMMSQADAWFTYSNDVLNATAYPDSQELILATDYMITDYSSIIFDFMLMRKPGFLFTVDLEEYKSDKGFYLEMEEYPFSYARNNQDMEKAIMEFDNDEYQKKIDAFVIKTGLKEKGVATRQLVELIMNYRKL